MNNFPRINISKTAHWIFFTIFFAYAFVIFNYSFVEASPAANKQSISNIQNMMLGKSNINARLSNGLDQPISDWLNKDVPFFYPVLFHRKTITDKPPKPDTNEVHIGGLDSRNYYTKEEVNYMISHGCIFSILFVLFFFAIPTILEIFWYWFLSPIWSLIQWLIIYPIEEWLYSRSQQVIQQIRRSSCPTKAATYHPGTAV